MKGKQESFFGKSAPRKLRQFDRRIEHGGDIAPTRGRRKLSRPVDFRKSLHLTFRSERAKGPWSMLRLDHERKIKKLTCELGKKCRVRIYQYANSGNHLHLLVKAGDESGFKRFTRSLAGIVARLVTGARKGRPKGKFWDGIFYSKIIEWGRHFLATKDYILRNELEALGVVDHVRKRERLLAHRRP